MPVEGSRSGNRRMIQIDVQASGDAQSQHCHPSKCDEQEQKLGKAADG
jgi:hypothetical protein